MMPTTSIPAATATTSRRNFRLDAMTLRSIDETSFPREGATRCRSATRGRAPGGGDRNPHPLPLAHDYHVPFIRAHPPSAVEGIRLELLKGVGRHRKLEPFGHASRSYGGSSRTQAASSMRWRFSLWSHSTGTGSTRADRARD